MQIKHRDFDFQIKAVETDGFFSGYGSVFGVKDSYDEVVAPGAFAKSLALREEKGRKLPVLWQHRAGEPIGIYEAVREDATGLYMEGRLLVNEIARAKEAHALMKAGAVSGLSIGFYTKADKWDEKGRVRTLLEIDLQETSIVTFPANDAARISGVKKIDDIKTLRDAEAMLRDACGLDRGEAKSLLARLRDVFAGTRDAEGEIKAAQDLLNRIREGARK